MARLVTKTGTRRLSEVAAHLVVPVGIATTGFPAVRDKLADLGIVLDEWQAGAGRLMLSKRADGQYAASIGGVVWSIPRQIGKTFTVGSILVALCLLIPGLTVLWTAHRTRTATETFRAMKGMTSRSKVKPHMLEPRNANGEQEIRFRNGSRILFGAREAGFGRGFTNVDVEVFDEAQILTDRALDDMLAAMNQPRNPAGALAVYIGTPPKPTDPGGVFTGKRKEALAGETSDMVYIEVSAERGTDPDDLDRVPEYNPSVPLRTPLASILRLRKQLSMDSYRREVMGQWDEDDSGGALSVEAWRALADPGAERGTVVAFGADVAEDRAAWVAAAWERGDGLVQVQLIQDEVLPAFRLVDRLVEIQARWDGVVVVPRSFEADTLDAGVRCVSMTAAEFAAGCGGFADGVAGGTFRHGNQEALNAAVKAARWRPSSTGERAFRLSDCPEVGPVAAAVRALHGLARHAGNDDVWGFFT